MTDTQTIQRMKTQLNEIRRWFYISAREKLGVSITGIPLPREEFSATGGDIRDLLFQEKQYDYMEPTAFDRSLTDNSRENEDEDAPTPKIYVAMGSFLHNAVEYLEMRQHLAEGGSASGLQSAERNVLHALKEVEKASLFPPFTGTEKFAENVAHHARAAYVMITADRVVSFEKAEMMLEKRSRIK